MSTQTPSKDSLDSTLERRIDETRRLVLRVDRTLATISLITILSGGLILMVLADHWLFSNGMGTTARVTGFTILGLIAAWFTYRRIVPLFLYTINPVYVAQILESGVPSIRNSIINWLLLRQERLQQSTTARNTLVEKMFEGVTQTAANTAETIRPNKVVDHHRLRHWVISLMILLLCFTAYSLLSPKSALTSVARIMMPFHTIDAPQSVQFYQIQPGHATAVQGEKLTISAELSSRGIPGASKPVYLFFTSEDGQAVRQAIPMIGPDGRSEARTLPNGKFEIAFPPGKQGFVSNLEYWIEHGNSRSDTFQIQVQPVATLEMARVTYRYPEYTGLSEETLKNVSDLRALATTEVNLIMKSSVELEQAELHFLDQEGSNQKMRILSNSKEASTTFTLEDIPRENADPIIRQFSFKAVDKHGIESRRSAIYQLEILPDRAPIVQWSDTSEQLKDVAEIELPVNAELELPIQAEDPDFGLRALTLHVEPQNKRIRTSELISAPSRGPTTFTGPIAVNERFSPAKNKLREGDSAEIWVQATDTKLPEGNKSSTRKITIRITAAEQKIEQPKEDPKDKAEDKKQPEEQRSEQQRSEQQQKKNKQQQNNEEKDPKNENKQDPSQEENQQNSDESQQEQDSKENPVKSNQRNEKSSDKNDSGEPDQKSGSDQKEQQGSKDQSQQQEQNSELNEKGQNGQKQQEPSIDPETNPGDAMEKILEQMKKDQQQDSQQSKKEKPEDQNKQKNNSKKNQDNSTDRKNEKQPDKDQNKDQSKDQQQNNEKQQKPNDKNEQKNNKQDKKQQQQDQQQQDKQDSDCDNGQNDQENSDENGQCDNNGNSAGGQSSQGGQEQGDQQGGSQGDSNGEQGTQSADGNSTGSESSDSSDPTQGDCSGGENQQQQADKQGKNGTKKQDTESQKGTKNTDQENSGQQSNQDENQGTGGGKNQSPAQNKGGETGGGDQQGTPNSSPEDRKGEHNKSDAQDIPVDPNDQGARKRDDSLDPNSKDRRSQGSDASRPKKTKKDIPNDSVTSGEEGKGQETNESGQSDRAQSADQGKPGDQGDEVEKEGGSPSKKGTKKQAGADRRDDPKGEQKSQSKQSGEPQESDCEGGDGTEGECEGGEGGKGRPGAAKSSSSQNDSPTSQEPNSNDTPQEGFGGGNPGTSAANKDTAVEEANREYTEQATNLVLEYLEDQLKDKPNQELLDRLGWSEEQLRAFHEKWKQMAEQAKKADPNSTEEQNWNEILKSLGIKPSRDNHSMQKNRTSFQDETRSSESRRHAAPPMLKRRMQQYTESIGKPTNNR